MAKLYRVVGPPGTGKTTWVARQCQRAVGVHGPDRVLVASLTRAAAREAAGRDTGLAPGQVGTLHSHCYHALGRPQLVTAKLAKEWNERTPQYALTVGDTGLENDGDAAFGEEQTDGDKILARVDRRRARLQPEGLWTIAERAFYAEWQEFKKEVDALDFTDLIEQGKARLLTAPGSPGAIFIDEAQDLSALELALVEQWAEHADTAVLVGDPYQALYHWRGASPDVLAGALHKVLDQSYRVPRAVQQKAIEIMRHSSDWRDDIAYNPRDTEGRLERTLATWQNPEPLLEILRNREENVMVLASCSYMLAPTLRLLRREGIPYHNPYSNKWNPMRESMLEKVRSLLRFAAPRWGGPEPEDFAWRPEELRSWLPLLRSARNLDDADDTAGAKLRGAPEPWGESETDGRVYVERYVATQAVHALLAGDLEWVYRSATKDGWRSLEYPLAILQSIGWAGIAETPRVIVGTVHSVKGGEAGSVIVFPDLSPSALRSYNAPGWDGIDGIWRLFYVAATRAKERLIIGAPVTESRAVRL